MSVMLSLGNFKFSISTASYSELVKTWKWNWSSQTLIGRSDRLQVIGKAPVSITLTGEVMPLFNNAGLNQIENLAKLGDEMKPQMLISGVGDVLGHWVILSVSERSSKFMKGGFARIQAFSIEILFYEHQI